MKTVGVRELKNRLSEYIRRVRSGEGVLVTDRGEVVAELSTPGTAADTSVPPGLVALARRGSLTLAAPRGGDVYRAIPRKRRRGRSTARLLAEERGDR